MARRASLIKRKRTVKAIRHPKEFELFQMYGFKPEWAGVADHKDPAYRKALGHALNWCARGVETNAGKKELLFWMGENGHKAKVRDVRAMEDWNMVTSGKLAYLANNTFTLDEVSIAFIERDVAKLAALGKNLRSEIAAAEKRDENIDRLRRENVVAPETRNEIDACGIWSDIEDLVFLKTFNEEKVRDVLKRKKAVVIDKAIENLNALLTELKLFGNDEQVTEYYENVGKRGINRTIKNVEEAIAIMNNEKVNKTVGRKPRVVKVKSVAQQIARLKYRERDNTLGIVSVDPSTIIGATKMVVFNTKTRMVGIYYAKDEHGLGVKSTTILNYDEGKSLQKRVRETKAQKMVDVIRKFRTAPLKRCDTHFAELKTVEVKLRSRLNEDFLILKVYS